MSWRPILFKRSPSLIHDAGVEHIPVQKESRSNKCAPSDIFKQSLELSGQAISRATYCSVTSIPLSLSPINMVIRDELDPVKHPEIFMQMDSTRIALKIWSSSFSGLRH